MFTFGWLTIAAEDLAVWAQFPDATFTLVKTATPTAPDAGVELEAEFQEEFHLGAFELPVQTDR